MPRKYAVLSRKDIPADGVGVVQIDDRELRRIIGNDDVAEEVVAYIESLCDRAKVNYA
ncbi:hypothetical protein BEL01nite_17050 [Bradyrhizobium elkanii]|nr:hypothetical protein BEL01nite_17050 [Bradyrhizobium elkanii]